MTSILIGLFQKKSKQVVGVEDIEFPRVLKKQKLWKFQGSIKKEVKLPGVFKKNSREISVGLDFDLGISRVSHNFAEFPRVKAFFLRDF